MIKSFISRQQPMMYRYGIPFLGLLAVGVVGFFIYNSFNVSREQEASRAFAESHDLYEQALAAQTQTSDKGKNKLWPEVELAFKAAYDNYSKSALATFFLAFQAEALLQQEKRSEALSVMDSMLARLEKNSAFYGLYANKRALMKLDMSGDEIKQQGLRELSELAEDASNISRDSSWYYLGEYYWSNNELDKAKVAWKQLEDINMTGKTPTPSPWFALVQARLETI